MKHSHKKSKMKKKKKPQQQNPPAAASEIVVEAVPLPIPIPNPNPIPIEEVGFAFGSVALEDARGSSDDKAAATLLRAFLSQEAGNPSSSSCSSAITTSDLGTASGSDSGSGWSEGPPAAGASTRHRYNNKAKRSMATTGTISTVLGKEYMKTSHKTKTSEASRPSSEETEQFLMGMLGDECELSFAVVRDVLCQCGYNVEKALDVLLDISASSDGLSMNKRSIMDHANSHEDMRFIVSSDESFADRESECTTNSWDSEIQDSIWFNGNTGRLSTFYRNYYEALGGSEIHSSTCGKPNESNISQEVLESFYKIHRSPQCEPGTMNWRRIAKKTSSFSDGSDVGQSIIELPKGEEYSLYRKEAQRHWDSMKSSYQKAATAYSKGEKSYAAYLSEQGKKHSKMGQEADERASQEIFRAMNKSIENVITIDLHGQHVKQGMKLLKFHLLVPSIQKLRVITGCGSHGAGNSKLKQMVIRLAQKEGVEYVEENRGTVVMKLDGAREFSFVDFDSDSD